MTKCLGPTLVYSPWVGFDETERSYWPNIFEFGLAKSKKRALESNVTVHSMLH